MHHFTDPDAAVKELHRVLRPGGRLLLIDEDFDDPAHPAHEEIHARRHRDGRHFDDVDPAAIGEKLRSAGFTVQEATTTAFAARPAKIVRATKG
jgi:SAM-dependent methyltransferase